ncbi:unnamed protein product [Candidatus Paraburkholderia kirkii UZHbot1]|uniref:WGS project CAFE00000000 data, contig bkir_c189 n=1 Tax=Candidatus Paraburkholderia kirkii UZHbot1 TaxID=1055526 RepID=U3UAM7_9BURK|nr:unnamed protein product [Candidatus Paraburkholderia kirkii UZHbot1]
MGCSLPVAATTVPGGVITFIGALVAPQYNVFVGPAPGSHASTAAQTRMTDASDRTTYVTFASDPRNPPSAEFVLSVMGHAGGADALTASFRDGKGNVMEPSAAGAYRLGPLGGTLSMSARDNATSLPRVTLITNYH